MIGQLDTRVTLEIGTRTPDTAGGASMSWTVVATLWAKVIPVSARERTDHQRRAHVISHRVMVRFRADVTPEMRIVIGNRVLAIAGIRDPDESHRWLVLDCIEGAPQ